MKKTVLNSAEPERKCIVCGRKSCKSNLLRLVFDECLKYDENQVYKGRGGYICKNASCITKAANSKVINRAFRLKAVEAPDMQRLISQLKCAAQ